MVAPGAAAPELALMVVTGIPASGGGGGVFGRRGMDVGSPFSLTPYTIMDSFLFQAFWGV